VARSSGRRRCVFVWRPAEASTYLLPRCLRALSPRGEGWLESFRLRFAAVRNSRRRIV